MKKLVTSYTFNAVAKTIVSADFVSLDAILLITNVTDNVIVYNFAGVGKGGTLAGTTLTLDYDTSGMDNGDSLQIFIDDLVTPSTALNQTTLNDLIGTLQELVQRLAPLAGVVANTAQLRVVATGSVTASGGGYITSAQSIAQKAVAGISYPEKVAITNLTAIQSNINNVSIT